MAVWWTSTRRSHRVRLWTAVGALGATLMSVVAAPTAWARASELPPIGAEIPMSCYATDAQVQIRDATIGLDFRGGVKERVLVNPGDPISSVLLQAIGFRMDADLLDPIGDARSIGKVVLEQNEIDITPQGLLRQIQNSPPKFDNTQPAITVSMTVDDGEEEPMVFVSKGLFTLKNTAPLSQYPPRGDRYELSEPVEFVNPDDPDTTVATIHGFSARCGGL